MSVCRCRKTVVILTLVASLVFGPAWAQEARLTNIIVNNTRDDLVLYLNVQGAFTEEMKGAVMSGVPATFSFFIEIYRVRHFWINENISDETITHTVKYNNLKKEFSVKRSWEPGPPLATQSFDEAQRLMSQINSLKVVPLSKLEKGQQYQIRAKAKLSKVTLPFYLHYVLFFLSLWDFETDWYTVDFIY